MPKPVIDYVVSVKVKGEYPSGVNTLARLIREALHSAGYDATVRVQVRQQKVPVVFESPEYLA